MTRLKIHLTRERIINEYMSSGIHGVIRLLNYGIKISDDKFINKISKMTSSELLEEYIVNSMLKNK